MIQVQRELDVTSVYVANFCAFLENLFFFFLCICYMFYIGEAVTSRLSGGTVHANFVCMFPLVNIHALSMGEKENAAVWLRPRL